MKLAIFVCFFVLSISTPVYADCYYKGQKVDEGTIRGNYKCKDGKWVLITAMPIYSNQLSAGQKNSIRCSNISLLPPDISVSPLK